MRAIPVHYTVDLCRRILNRNESTIVKVHDLFAETSPSDGVDPREPGLVLAPAGEPVFVVGALEEEVSNRRVM